ncbi:MAG: efflux RND transporter permease subunit [Gammaproteobacteria bacterium]|jgi:multidrug efflux pump|nr:efflux RND transporter permease subunit [Gammaproteobacteria bacterium]MBT3860042.1 efflux RND transporter permease subunit [Gammaproteobacteria bacterium]MBT3987008.1 efflux RND transporter permease subunit [Gammaproteobacteria bacterium]MBT4580727.1 efflux RND transporter permease subunit [Gammaproteobacteria bacterium]MBT4658662.1 efflux RND transporter permease subunit [Gammaproteobacteria bacterium]
MTNYIDAAVSRSRTTLSIFVAVMLTGFVSYLAIPVELNPDVAVPIVITTIIHEGISPEDAERLLAKPAELELKTVDGITSVSSFSSENAATIVTEFDIDFESQFALSEVREAINRAKARFPADTEEPLIQEVSAATLPVVQIAIGGEGVPERVLLRIAEDLQREIEILPPILEATMVGNREELLEAVIDPAKLETYGIPSSAIIQTVMGNNRLIPAGQVDTGGGSFAVKVPGLIETADDLFDLPLASTDLGVLTISDIADVRRTFKDATRYSYANGSASISLNVMKRKGANLVQAMEQIDGVVQAMIPSFPPAVSISYINNTAPIVVEQNMGLQGNMATAMILVLLVVIASVGVRSGLLVTLAVPFSFFFAFIIIRMLGFTYNFMVMFGLLLGLGMLIDGAIVMVEFADRKMAEGLDAREAYKKAVERMFWPIMASTATTLAAFLPIMFWPGVTGQFMSYLPITVFAVLTGSLFYALLFAPTIGALIGKSSDADKAYLRSLESGDPRNTGGITAFYAAALERAVRFPITVSVLSLVTLVTIVMAYGRFGKGVEFFTEVEPNQTTVQVFSRGNFSPSELRDIMLDAEERIRTVGHFKGIVTQSGAGQQMGGFQQSAPDLVGSIFIEMTDRRDRDIDGFEVENEYRRAISNLPGARAEVVSVAQGPPVGKAIQLELAGDDLDELFAEAERIHDHMENGMSGLIDIDDTTPVPGIQWEIVVDRARAAMLGASMAEIGTAIQLMTNGVFMGDYRPTDSEEEVDIRVRYPVEYRGLDQIDSLRISTLNGPVPLSSFVTREAKPAVSSIQRVDGDRVVYIRANAAPGVVADNKVQELEAWIEANPPRQGVYLEFRGANEEQEDSAAFLVTAFSLSMALMAILLVTQFNSYYQALLILSSVLLSTAGVLLGLLTTGQTFSIMLTGIGIVALAGIIVNNNIVLIDTYNHLRNEHKDWSLQEIIVHTGVQRLRPVFLTTFTTGFGLLPLAMHVSIDLIGAEVEVGGPITSQWVSLASAIVFGLSFGTILTLIVTPAMLALPDRLRNMIGRAPKHMPIMEAELSN